MSFCCCKNDYYYKLLYNNFFKCIMILYVVNIFDLIMYIFDSEIRLYYNKDFKIRLIFFVFVDNIL